MNVFWYNKILFIYRKEKFKKKNEEVNEISDPILLEQFIAVADYKKKKSTECSLSAGQIIEVIDKNENGMPFSMILLLFHMYM